MTPLVQEYAQSLAALTGNEFQCEVCARLQTAILGFQMIPAKPQGDAGLDGFSHNGQRGYCCYGPEHDEFKTAKQRENAIVDKFRSDLRRVCELGFDKKKLVCIESPENGHDPARRLQTNAYQPSRELVREPPHPQSPLQRL